MFNFAAKFKDEVIENFIRAYESGLTPNPCIDCNRYIKFEKLYLRARELDCRYIATGHYAKIERDTSNRPLLLKKAADSRKDQSYVLYTLTQEQLANTLFPLGDLTKSRVREIAEENGLANAKKLESQDICFVRGKSYADFIKEYTGKAYPHGDFIDSSGKVLGRHRGIIHYTIGQRKRLGISSDKPLYVCRISARQNTVTLGGEAELYLSSLTVKRINLIAVDSIERPMRVKVKTRYRQPEQWAVVSQLDEDTLFIKFDTPQRAITAGQAAVLYDGDIVIGGGTITGEDK